MQRICIAAIGLGLQRVDANWGEKVGKWVSSYRFPSGKKIVLIHPVFSNWSDFMKKLI